MCSPLCLGFPVNIRFMRLISNVGYSSRLFVLSLLCGIRSVHSLCIYSIVDGYLGSPHLGAIMKTLL